MLCLGLQLRLNEPQFPGNIFSKIDLQNAFLQIPPNDDSEVVTTITKPFGLFAYNLLPFGHFLSPSLFQKTLSSAISRIDPARDATVK